MAIKLKPGQIKTGAKSTYEIVREINNGMFASAFEAKNRSGRKVFLKNINRHHQPSIGLMDMWLINQNSSAELKVILILSRAVTSLLISLQSDFSIRCLSLLKVDYLCRNASINSEQTRPLFLGKNASPLFEP